MVRGYDFTTGVTFSGGVGEMGELNLGSRGLGIIFFSLSIIDLLKQIFVLFLIYLLVCRMGQMKPLRRRSVKSKGRLLGRYSKYVT